MAAAKHEIECIVPDGSDPYHAIDRFGGSKGAENTGGRWSVSLAEAIAGIRAGKWAFFTYADGQYADVYIAERNGREYLTTTRDSTTSNNLLNLPHCP